ncbi:MAG: DUF5666 domain-containing protein [Candidatus Acidiferrum sp.]
MMHKILVAASLGSMLLLGTPGVMLGQAQGQQGQQSQQATKSVTGKVTGIGDQGHSFTVESDSSTNKQTMQFVVDKNTQVQGQVKVGTPVQVEYETLNGGQLVCVRVSAQG